MRKKSSELNLTKGIVNLNKDLSRAEAAQLMMNYVKLGEKSAPKVDISILSKIKDADKIPTKYKEAVAYMYQLGLLKGNQLDEFMPNDTLKRQEVVVILSRVLLI